MCTSPLRVVTALLLAPVIAGYSAKILAQSNTVPVAPPPAAGTAPKPAPTYADDPKFQKALAQAKERRMDNDERLSRWKNANKIAKGQCVECLHQVVTLQLQQGQWKDAANSAGQLDAVATEPKDKAFAEAQRGAALLHSNNDEPKPEQLKEAESSLHSALTIAPHSPTVI